MQRTREAVGPPGALVARRPGLLERIYRARLAYLFLLPSVGLMLIFIVYPILDALRLSLYRWQGIGQPRFIGLTNFQAILRDRNFWEAIQHNLLFSLVTVAGTVIIGFLLAAAVDRRVRGWQWFKVIYFIPVMIPMTVVGVLWGRIYDPTTGLINVALQTVGLGALAQNWLGDPNLALLSVAAVSVWQYAGFPMVIFLAAMQNISTEIHDAATLDGVNAYQRIRHIILPLVRNVMATIVLLQVIFSFRVFDIVWVMTEGRPGTSSEVLLTYLYRTAFQNQQFGYGSAIAVVMIAIIFVLSMAYLRLFNPERIEY